MSPPKCIFSRTQAIWVLAGGQKHHLHRMLAKLGKARFQWKHMKLPRTKLSFRSFSMDSRESREFRRFEGIREDRGKARAQAPLAKQVQFRGKRPPKSACKRSFKRHKTVPGTGLKAGPFGLRASSNCSTQTCLPSTTKTTENFQKLQFKTKKTKKTLRKLSKTFNC